MTAGELATAVRYNLKIVVVVLTDNDLALIRIKQQKKGNPIYGTPVRPRPARSAGLICSECQFVWPTTPSNCASNWMQHLLETARSSSTLSTAANTTASY